MLTDSQAKQCGYRTSEDDFFCEKYQVWYPMRDCNYRVLHRTYEGCSDCFQGRVNLRRLPPHPEASAVNAQLSAGTLLSFPEPEEEATVFDSAPGAGPAE